MSGSLVRDLPDAVDPEQTVEVNPPIGSRVKAELDGGGIAHLSHRDDAPHHARSGRRSPFLEALGDQVLMKDALGVNEENLGVFVKRFL